MTITAPESTEPVTTNGANGQGNSGTPESDKREPATVPFQLPPRWNQSHLRLDSTATATWLSDPLFNPDCVTLFLNSQDGEHVPHEQMAAANRFGLETDRWWDKLLEGRIHTQWRDPAEMLPLLPEVFDSEIQQAYGVFQPGPIDRTWRIDGETVSKDRFLLHHLVHSLDHVSGSFVVIVRRAMLDTDLVRDRAWKSWVYHVHDLGDSHWSAVYGMSPYYRSAEADKYDKDVYGKPEEFASLKVEHSAGYIKGCADVSFERHTAQFRTRDTKWQNRHSSYARMAVMKAWPQIGEEAGRRARFAAGKESGTTFHVKPVEGGRIHIALSDYAKLVLAKKHQVREVEYLHRKHVNHFAQNERDWTLIERLGAEGILMVDPKVPEMVEEVLHGTRLMRSPNYPVPRTQRMGFLTDIEEITCIRSSEKRGFEAGKTYRVRCSPQKVESHDSRTTTQGSQAKYAGQRERFLVLREMQAIRIGRESFFDSWDHIDDVKFIADHFDLPDPGDLATRFPNEVLREKQTLWDIERDVIAPNSERWSKENSHDPPVRFKQFQREDLARLFAKRGGMLTWEMGLGKTLAGATFIEWHKRDKGKQQALIVCPKDLIPQWQRELKRFLGIEATVIEPRAVQVLDKKTGKNKTQKVPMQAVCKEIHKHLTDGGEGVYIVHYEGLSRAGVQASVLLPEIPLGEPERVEQWGYYWLDEEGSKHKIASEKKARELQKEGKDVHHGSFTTTKQKTSKTHCPHCGAKKGKGWDGKSCRAIKSGQRCQYQHYEVKVKAPGSFLSGAFKQGVIVIDEVTKIQAKDTGIGLTLRGLNANAKLGLTGSPIRNYIHQAFNPLWWTLGNQSPRFPYGLADYNEFQATFGAIEYKLSKDGMKGARKARPEVSNLSRLWRLLASGMIRRRRENTGEKLVPMMIHPVPVPLGTAQFEQMETWRTDFAKFFAEKYPDSDVVKAGMQEKMEMLLGLLPKLDYSDVCPLADPDHEWADTDDLSNFTPANAKVLELILALRKEGRKVLFGSFLRKETRFIEEQLNVKGVKATHLLSESDDTLSPEKRAKIVGEFQTGDTEVLCASIQAIRFGHNLDQASAVVINGLPWDAESLQQFIKRAHRLTSKQPVDLYVVLPGINETDQFTLQRRKWQMLKSKFASSAVALDGHLIEDPEDEKLDEKSVVKQFLDQGVQMTGDEIPEHEIHDWWHSIKDVESFEPPENLLGETAESFADQSAADATALFRPENWSERPELVEIRDEESADPKFVLIPPLPTVKAFGAWASPADEALDWIEFHPGTSDEDKQVAACELCAGREQISVELPNGGSISINCPTCEKTRSTGTPQDSTSVELVATSEPREEEVAEANGLGLTLF